MAVEAELGKRARRRRRAACTRPARATTRSRSTCACTCATKARACSGRVARAGRRRSPSAPRARRSRSCPRTPTGSARSPSAAGSSWRRGRSGSRARPTRSSSRSSGWRCRSAAGRARGRRCRSTARSSRASSLPWQPTRNALHTVGDRDFALDWTWAAARVVLALGRIATDMVDFSTSEFGLVKLDGAIAAGLEHDAAEEEPRRLRARSRQERPRAIGNVVALLTLMKGLRERLQPRPAGRPAARCSRPGRSRAGARAWSALALPHVTFDRERGRRALADGFTQATDLAEALGPPRACRSARPTRPWGGSWRSRCDEGRRPASRSTASRAPAIAPGARRRRARAPSTRRAPSPPRRASAARARAPVAAQIAWLRAARRRAPRPRADRTARSTSLAPRVFAEPLRGDA